MYFRQNGANARDIIYGLSAISCFLQAIFRAFSFWFLSDIIYYFVLAGCRGSLVLIHHHQAFAACLSVLFHFWDSLVYDQIVINIIYHPVAG